MLLIAAALAAQPLPPTVPSNEEIVVTARRTGVPVWRVRNGAATLVLVGTIADVARGTPWNAAALETTIARANRVMFPQRVGLTASPFQLGAWLVKWKRQARLPKNQSLSALVSPVQRSHLETLAARGYAPRDWDRLHPLHLALNIQDRLRDSTGMAPDAGSVVQRAIRKHRVSQVPIERGKASPIVKDLFASNPADHVPCLDATILLAAAGPVELRRRSTAWANREVASAIRSPVEEIEDRCWPATTNPTARQDLLVTANRSLSGRGTVVAVIDLGSLARNGGLLDRLKASGAVIDGPDWR